MVSNQIRAAKVKQRLTAHPHNLYYFIGQGGNLNCQKCGHADPAPQQQEENICLSVSFDLFYILLL